MLSLLQVGAQGKPRKDLSGRNQVSLAFHLIKQQICWALSLFGDDKNDACFLSGASN